MAKFEDAVVAQAGMDPVTQALIAPLREAVRLELEAHEPGRLTRTQEEARKILGVGDSTIRAMVADGRLQQLEGGPRSPITLASILMAAGWPMREAPLAAPLSVVPEESRAS